jgi:hypothetical protein
MSNGCARSGARLSAGSQVRSCALSRAHEVGRLRCVERRPSLQFATSRIIQGPICDRLLESSGTVEIVLGCPTILI